MDEPGSVRPHRRPLQVTCRATAKRSGVRCKWAPIPGGTMCVKHGGGAPQVRRAAERRLVEAAARTALWRLQNMGAMAAIADVHPAWERPPPDQLRLAARHRTSVRAD